MMRLIPVESIPKLNATPLAKLVVESPRVMLEVDDASEARVRLVFEPYQAVRLTTADCFILPNGLSIVPQTVTELSGSSWLDELRLNLGRVDATAKFMNEARHFIVPLQDDFLEVVAWGVSVEDT